MDFISMNLLMRVYHLSQVDAKTYKKNEWNGMNESMIFDFNTFKSFISLINLKV